MGKQERNAVISRVDNTQAVKKKFDCVIKEI